MRMVIVLSIMFSLASGLSLAAENAAKKGTTLVGTISDKMCGAKHMMPGKTAKECTLECGAPFVLVTAQGKVYDLSDKEKPKEFAGQKVKVTGALKGSTIEVSSIKAAQ